tara:strand:- start:108 stop:974 length:867 start_codon:yes stop_codon:yes gene_type:complete
MIISHNNSGLCNRIKSWASSVRIDEECYVNWETFTRVRCENITYPSFESLFENKNSTIDQKFTSSVSYNRPDHVFEKGKHRDKSVLKYYNSPYLAVLPEDNINRCFIKNNFTEKGIIDHQYQKTPQHLIKTYSKIFDKIKFKRSIIDQADKFFDEKIKNADNLVTVHVRSFCDSLDRKQMWFDINNFIREMKKHDSIDNIFYVSADDDELISLFKDEFGDKIIFYPKEVDPNIDMGSYKSQVEAIIDLTILGRGSTMLATETSTFSEVAWWMSKSKPNVKKIGNIIYE